MLVKSIVISDFSKRSYTIFYVKKHVILRASGPAPTVLRLGRAWLSASIGGGIFLFLPWLAWLVGLSNGRVSADGSPGWTDDGRIVRDFNLEPTAREVSLLGKSCATSIKDSAIFPPHQKKKKFTNTIVKT